MGPTPCVPDRLQLVVLVCVPIHYWFNPTPCVPGLKFFVGPTLIVPDRLQIGILCSVCVPIHC